MRVLALCLTTGLLPLAWFAAPALGRRPPLGRRVPLGFLRGRALYLATRSSLLVVGPTQSGKTTGVAIPAIIGWDGPVIATSVKGDLLASTAPHREGPCFVLDPGGSTGATASSWSPLKRATTRRGSREVVSDLLEGVRSSQLTGDGEFWLSVAGRLLAPLLQAAAISGVGVEGAIAWIDAQSVDEVAGVLATAGEHEAEQAWIASWSRDERIVSSALATALTVLEPVSEVGHGEALDAGVLIDRRGTAYLCAPLDDQRRYAGLFVAVLRDVIGAATARSLRSGKPLDPPLLCVLDEAAAIAPLPELDTLAATLAGQGVVLVTIVQDLAQLRARYGERSGTILSNHAARLFFPGIADPATLEILAALAGDDLRRAGRGGRAGLGEDRRSARPATTYSSLRTLPKGRAVLIQAARPAVQVRLRRPRRVHPAGLALRSWQTRTPSSWPGRHQAPSFRSWIRSWSTRV